MVKKTEVEVTGIYIKQSEKLGYFTLLFIGIIIGLVGLFILIFSKVGIVFILLSIIILYFNKKASSKVRKYLDK